MTETVKGNNSNRLISFIIERFIVTTDTMRPLTDQECQVFFEKLSKYIGDNIKQLLERPDGKYCFRFHKDRVYYCKEELMKKAGHIARENLLSFGTCFGKFTKSGKYRLHVTALDFLAPYAKFKVWLKPNAEQQFLYGNHVMKAGLGRITEATPQFQGVVVYNMSDLPLYLLGLLKLFKDHDYYNEFEPHAYLHLVWNKDVRLGFGVAAKSTQECRHADPMATIAFHQADIGEYLRNEERIT